MRYVVAKAEEGSKELDELLADGYEPFGLLREVVGRMSEDIDYCHAHGADPYYTEEVTMYHLRKNLNG